MLTIPKSVVTIATTPVFESQIATGIGRHPSTVCNNTAIFSGQDTVRSICILTLGGIEFS